MKNGKYALICSVTLRSKKSTFQLIEHILEHIKNCARIQRTISCQALKQFMFLDGLFGQNKPEKENSHFLTLKKYKKEAFSDTISRFYTHFKQDVDLLLAKFQVDITTND